MDLRYGLIVLGVVVLSVVLVVWIVGDAILEYSVTDVCDVASNSMASIIGSQTAAEELLIVLRHRIPSLNRRQSGRFVDGL